MKISKEIIGLLTQCIKGGCNSWKASILSALPLLLALLAYHGVTRCGFIGLDDDLYVYQNPMVMQGLTWSGFRWAWTAIHASTWQPLIWLSYMADVSMWGVDAGALHRTNLILHLVTIVLFYHALLKITHSIKTSLIATLLFAVHPIHVESVAWIAARKDVLSTPFWWAGILAYLAYIKIPSKRRFAAIVAILVLGLMAKPMLMTFPFVLLLLDVWPLRRIRLDCFNGWIPVLREKSLLFAIVLGSFLLSVYVQSAGESILDLETVTLWGRFSNATVSIWRYIGKLVWPVNLAVLYPHPGAYPVAWTVISTLGLVTLLYLAWHQREHRPWLLFGLLWFCITFVPVSGLIQFGWHGMADRFMYIPATGIYLIAAFSMTSLIGGIHHQWRKPLAVAFAGTLLLLVSRTQHQVDLWKDSLTLFSHATEVTRDNWMMHNGVGTALSRRGRNDEAAPHFEKAIHIKPDRPKPYFNLGHVRFMQGRWQEAIVLFEKSLSLRPTIQAHYNLALSHLKDGNLEAAEASFSEVLDIQPMHRAAQMALADIWRQTLRLDKAISLYERILEDDPDNERARVGRGLVLLEQGHTVEALRELVTVLRDNPSHPEANKAIRRAMTPESLDDQP